MKRYVVRSQSSWKGNAKNCRGRSPTRHELLKSKSPYKTFKSSDRLAMANSSSYDKDGNRFITYKKVNNKVRENFQLVDIMQSNHQWCQDCNAKYVEDCLGVSKAYQLKTDDKQHWKIDDLEDRQQQLLAEGQESFNIQDALNKIDSLRLCITSRFEQNFPCYSSNRQTMQDLSDKYHVVVEPEHNSTITRVCRVLDGLQKQLKNVTEEKDSFKQQNKEALTLPEICTNHLHNNHLLDKYNQEMANARSTNCRPKRTSGRRF